MSGFDIIIVCMLIVYAGVMAYFQKKDGGFDVNSSLKLAGEIVETTVAILDIRKRSMKETGEWNTEAKRDLKNLAMHMVMDALPSPAISLISKYFNIVEYIGEKIETHVKKNKKLS